LFSADYQNLVSGFAALSLLRPVEGFEGFEEFLVSGFLFQV
jgi:hypothetical protein